MTPLRAHRANPWRQYRVGLSRSPPERRLLGCGRLGDEVADALGVAASGVEGAGPIAELLEVALQFLEFGDPRSEFLCASLQQGSDVFTRGLAAVS